MIDLTQAQIYAGRNLTPASPQIEGLEGIAERSTISTTILTHNEASKYLNIKPRTLYHLVTEEKVPGAKVGGRHRYSLEKLNSMFGHTAPESAITYYTVLDINEASDYLRIKKRTLYSLVSRGLVPGIKVGGQWRFTREMLDELFKKERKSDK